MVKYTTLVYLQEDIFDRFQMYRGFLEKDSLGTSLKEVQIKKIKTAGEISPAELALAKDVICVYGMLTADEYCKQKEEIHGIFEENPNPQYYMIFCQKQFNESGPYDNSLEIRPECGGGVPAIAVIENNKEEGYEDFSEETLENLRCLKLLSLVTAICNENENDLFEIGNTYVTAKIDLNFNNIYYAILCKLSEYADKINIINFEIDKKNQIIDFLENCKPKKCEANFTDNPDLPDAESSDLLENSKDILQLSRNMGVEYDRGVGKIRNSISNDLQVVHKALATAEEYDPLRVLSDKNGEYVDMVEKSDELQQYMMIYDADEKEIAVGDDLLDRPDKNVMFDAKKIEAVLPLAREFKKTDKPKFSGIAIAAVCGVLAFALCVCSVYLARWLKHGVVASVPDDFFNMIAVPMIAMLIAAAVVFLVSVVRYLIFKSTFKKIRKALKAFLNESVNMYASIREYINKYLTVYYNYHIRLSRIEQLKDDILVLRNRVQKIQQEALPYEMLAENVFASMAYEDKGLDFLEEQDRSKIVLLEKKLVEEIRRNSKTRCRWYDSKDAGFNNPWIAKLSIELANINSKKGGRQ